MRNSAYADFPLQKSAFESADLLVSVAFETPFVLVCFKLNFFQVMQLVILQINLVLRIITSG